MQKEKTSHKTLTENVHICTDAHTDKRTEREKLYTPRHTSYAEGITNPFSAKQKIVADNILNFLFIIIYFSEK